MRLAIIQIKANDLRDASDAWEQLEGMVLEAALDHDLILVPEAAYPAYFLHPHEGELEPILHAGEARLERIKEIARQHQVYIAYGYAEQAGDKLYNSALLIDRSGQEVVKKRKSFLWHFDHMWFSEGEDLAIADTEFGRVGVVVCADARMPEIVRLAALEGAELIIDLANLTATGPDISALQNAQSAYMLSIRALENQLWLAVSDKWGVEAASITYTGRSGVFAPNGTCVYQAGSDRNEIVSIDIPTDEHGRIQRERSAAYQAARRPELYHVLTRDTEELPIVALMEEKVAVADHTPYITAAAGEFRDEASYMQMISRLVHQGGQIVCMPPVQLDVTRLTSRIAQVLPENVIVIATRIVDEAKEVMTSYVISEDGIKAEFNTSHQTGASDNDYPIYATKWGKIGIIHGTEALLPEWPRSLMLLGADCLIWLNHMPYSLSSNIARTRAAESRMYIVSVQDKGVEGSVSQIVDPNGTVLASTLQGEKTHACGALTPFVNSRMKVIVPGTHVVLNRHPANYRRLTL